MLFCTLYCIALNCVHLCPHRVSQIQFTDLFAGPMPVFEITKRVKNAMPAFTSKNKKDPAKKAKGQGTLDSWVKGDGKKSTVH